MFCFTLGLEICDLDIRHQCRRLHRYGLFWSNTKCNQSTKRSAGKGAESELLRMFQTGISHEQLGLDNRDLDIRDQRRRLHLG